MCVYLSVEFIQFSYWRNRIKLIKNALPSSPAGSFALTASKQARRLSSLVESNSNGTIWPGVFAASGCCGLLSPAPPGSPSFCRSDSIAFRILTDGEPPVGSSRPANTYRKGGTWRYTLCFESPSSPQSRVPLRYTHAISTPLDNVMLWCWYVMLNDTWARLWSMNCILNKKWKAWNFFKARFSSVWKKIWSQPLLIAINFKIIYKLCLQLS